MADPTVFDEDAFTAGVDLVGRTGARNFEVGYLHDDVPADQAGWYAHAQYQGARITAEDQPGPVEAVEALARQILTGGKCVHCGGLVSLGGGGALFRGTEEAPAVFSDGSTMTADEARARPQCRWTRMGSRWARGCEDTNPAHTGPNRAQRRAATREARR